MTKKLLFKKISLISVFLLGNMIIAFPKGYSSKYGLYGFLLCLVISALFSIFYIKFQSCYTGGFTLKNLCCNKIITTAISVIFMLFTAICYSICMRDYIVMVDKIRLPNTPKIIITVVFAALSIWLGTINKKSLYSLAVIALIFSCSAVLIMFALSVPTLDITLIKHALSLNTEFTLRQAASFYIQSFGQIIICVLFIGALSKKTALKTHLLSLCVSGGIFLICLITTAGLIGLNLINKIDFPYATATAIINSSRDYTRLDIMTYFIFFITSLIKSAVIYKVSIEIAGGFGFWLKIFIGAALPILTVISCISCNLSEFLNGDIIGLALLLTELALPPVIYILNKRNYASE